MEDVETNQINPEQISRKSKTGLSPCPFCGSVQLSIVTYEKIKPLTIECSDCGATGPIGKVREEIEQDAEKRIQELRLLWEMRRNEV